MDDQVVRVRAGLRRAFTALRAQGYTAEANFGDCPTCAVAALAERGLDTASSDSRYVFYTAAGHAQLAREGSVSLHWGGDAVVITGELIAAGLNIDWGGTTLDLIMVKGIIEGGHHVAT